MAQETKQSTEKKLIELEHSYWQALMDNDVAAALRLTDDPCVVTGAQGVGMLDKKSLGQMMKNPGYTLRDFDLKDVKVRMISDDVAIVAYEVHEELTVEGKSVTLDAAESSTWVRRNGGWVCTLHTEAIKGDPFGRDRRPMQSKSAH